MIDKIIYAIKMIFQKVFNNPEYRRKKAIEEGKDIYWPYDDGFLCLSVEESVEEFFEGLY